MSLTEIGSDGLNVYECRYDEDDFGSAYAELERRYYAGEGAAFAVNGHGECELSGRRESRRFQVRVWRIHQPRISGSRAAQNDRVSRLGAPSSINPALRNCNGWSVVP